MSRQAIVSELTILKNCLKEVGCHIRWDIALTNAINELSKPTDADLMDAFLEKAEKTKNFKYKGMSYWWNKGRVYGVENDCPTYILNDVEQIYAIIQNQHLIEWEQPKKKLTDEQVNIFKALSILGFWFIGKQSNGCVSVFSVKSQKGRWWFINKGFSQYLSEAVSEKIKDLVSWDDEEPFNIRKALEEAGVEVEG